MTDKFMRTMFLYFIAYVLEKRNWDFENEESGELHFVLGNREIFTKYLSFKDVQNLFDEIILW